MDTEDDLERLDVILKVTRELGVNLAGVEIILNMREKMAAMQRQMEGFIEKLNEEISQRVSERPRDSNSLMPVVQMQAVVQQRSEPRRGEPRRKVR